MMDLIRRSGALLHKLITHTFPLSRVQEAWELQLTGNCGKVLLYPWEYEVWGVAARATGVDEGAGPN